MMKRKGGRMRVVLTKGEINLMESRSDGYWVREKNEGVDGRGRRRREGGMG